MDSFMELLSVGILTNLFWFEVKNHAKNIELGPFIIMPDHIHGVVNLINSISAVKISYALSLQIGRG